ncbi:unnamed protein product [Amoebophrya sp. A120]|nr:unnamed protein product [Amoebophrya sp. A120]|eukprot:GSA120T00021480001.1
MEFVRLQQLYRPGAKALHASSETGSEFANYRKRVENKEDSEVTGLAYNAEKGQFAVAHSTKISFWSLRTKEQVLQINKFKDFTTCMHARDDGKLLVAGEAGGSLAVIEWSEGSVLRRLRGHTNTPTCCGFSTNKTQILSGGKDRTLRLYDITSSTGTGSIMTWNHAHADFVQALCPSPDQSNIWLTGGAEGICKIWDSRVSNSNARTASTSGQSSSTSAGGNNNGCVGSYSYGNSEAGTTSLDPVSCVQFYPGSTMFVASAGTNMRVFDVRMSSDTAVVATFGGQHHTKDLSHVDVSPSGRYLLSSSLDGTNRVWDSADYTPLFTYNNDTTAVRLGKFFTDDLIATAQQNGSWCVRKKNLNNNGKQGDQKRKIIKNKAPGRGLPLTARYYKRGAEQPVPDIEKDGSVTEVIQLKKQKLNQVESALKNFQYRKALEIAIVKNTNLSYALSFLDELESRSALHQAVQNLPETVCLQVLQWVLRVIDVQEAVTFRRLIVSLFHAVVDANGAVVAENERIMQVINLLRDKVGRELSLQEKTLRPLLGMLDTVLSA